MADVHEPEIRSYNMSQIRSKNTKPEMIVRRFLHKNGYRYRLHVKDLSGKPDIVLHKFKTVIFVNGCFWHGHSDCDKYVIPKTRTDWWIKKISKNRENDIINREKLDLLGWRVITVYECELHNEKRDKTLFGISKLLSFKPL